MSGAAAKRSRPDCGLLLDLAYHLLSKQDSRNFKYLSLMFFFLARTNGLAADKPLGPTERRPNKILL